MSNYYPTKFNYHELKRNNIDGSRKYITPDGRAVPSVTTILGATKSAESKQALNNWKKRVGEKQAQAITTEAAGRGTRLHKWLEYYIKTGVIGAPGTNPYSIQSHEMAQIIISEGLKNCNEFWATEASLYYPEIYAGTTDLVGVHDGDEAIMDFKQTNKLKRKEWIEDYFLQLTAYGECHNSMFGTKIQKGVVFMCSANREYQEFIIDGDEYEHYRSTWWKRVEQYYLTIL